MTLDDVMSLAGKPLAEVAARLHADPDRREPVDGYQALADLDVVEAPGGARIFLRGDEVALIYLGSRALPPGADPEAMRAAAGSDGQTLRSRQGKRARMHVVADRGIAWSQQDDDIGFVELFPPTTFQDYLDTVYEEPMPFVR